jgi:hypothetical protein
MDKKEKNLIVNSKEAWENSLKGLNSLLEVKKEEEKRIKQDLLEIELSIESYKKKIKSL